MRSPSLRTTRKGIRESLVLKVFGNMLSFNASSPCVDVEFYPERLLQEKLQHISLVLYHSYHCLRAKLADKRLRVEEKSFFKVPPTTFVEVVHPFFGNSSS